MIGREAPEQFRAFVSGHTDELFATAYALAGRQDAAERLLQVALEHLALRWHAVADPYAYTVAVMRRASQPWWRRWGWVNPAATGSEAPAVAPTGGPGRPVDLGDAALIGARHRRLRRAGWWSVGAVVCGGVVSVAVLAAAGALSP